MYNKKYYEEHKEKFKESTANYRKQNSEKIKEYNKDYFQKNKEKMYKKQKEWRNKNKDKWIKCICDSRRKRIERLKEEGVINPWSVVTKGAKPRYKKERQDEKSIKN